MPPWQDGLAGYSARGMGSWRAHEGERWDDARMKLLVCGGAGFIGSTFVRLRLREHGDEVTVLDKLTYAGREENLREVAERPASASSTARSRTPRRSPRRSRARPDPVPRGDRELRRRDPRRPLDRRARRVRQDPRARHVRAARGRARRGRSALRAGLDRRGLRLDRAGLVHRGQSRCAPPRPTRRRRPARTCSCRATSTPTSCPP